MPLPSPPGSHGEVRDLLRLNHHHLLAFAAVMEYGGVHAAARHLGVAATTVSSQIKSLEASLGQPLFLRRRQRLLPSPFGERTFRLVSAWLAAGRRVLDGLAATEAARPEPLHLGIADGVPLLVAARILQAVHRHLVARPLVCRTARHAVLLDDLLHHRLELVLTDRPPPGGAELAIRWVESSGIAWCAAAEPERPFPDCLHHAPVILPLRGSAMRESIDAWLAQQGLEPRVVAECGESSLVKTLGAAGLGLFPVPDLVAAEVCRQYAAVILGRQPGETERYMLVAHRDRPAATLQGLVPG